MRLIGRPFENWWKLAKLTKGDFLAFTLLDYEYFGHKYNLDGCKVFIAQPPVSMSIMLNLEGNEIMVSREDSMMSELRFRFPFRDIEKHYHGRIDVPLAYRVRLDNHEVVVAAYRSNHYIDVTWHILRDIGFNVNDPLNIIHDIIRKRRYDYHMERIEEEINWHISRLKELVKKYRREDGKLTLRELRKNVEELSEHPLVEKLEITAAKIIVYTKPITIQTPAGNWSNSYIIEYDAMNNTIDIHGEKQYMGNIVHPHVKNGLICTAMMQEIYKHINSGDIYGAFVAIMMLLQSYDPGHTPYVTVEALLEYDRLAGEEQ